MRRLDREQDRQFALSLIDRCTHGVMALSTGEDTPYCLPLSFVRVGDDLYFHCAAQGRKLELLLPESEQEARLAVFVPKKKELSGYLKRYASLVTSGSKGAVFAD